MIQGRLSSFVQKVKGGAGVIADAYRANRQDAAYRDYAKTNAANKEDRAKLAGARSEGESAIYNARLASRASETAYKINKLKKTMR